MALTIGPKLQEFLDQALLATVCTLNSRRAAAMTPIWYQYFDGMIRYNGTSTRQWLKRMESGHLWDCARRWRDRCRCTRA